MPGPYAAWLSSLVVKQAHYSPCLVKNVTPMRKL
jgi:hypothetical protein